MYCIHQPGYSKALQLQLEEHKKKLKMEKEIEEASKKEKENEEQAKMKKEIEASKKEKEIEEQSKKEKETEVMQPEDEEGLETKIKELYNTSQKILIACVGDFAVAHCIPSTLGDASNIVVISQNSCGEVKRMYENARSQMLDLTKLGATIEVINQGPQKLLLMQFKDFGGMLHDWNHSATQVNQLVLSLINALSDAASGVDIKGLTNPIEELSEVCRRKRTVQEALS
ncbi:hypothetical protein L1987_19701 [Smallanthus sonchifolius]|uniref:Uncharacterized protein n=1 Tax=Smallanthus sonchifolius TaxID=185202 RepID=A0ACB9IRF9_9ASTR|nr:hypothetical protein L1987_19701 [Smallanthus sonchifolius]